MSPHVDRYGSDVLAGGARPAPPPTPEVPAELGTVVEDAAGGWCGAVVEVTKEFVLLEDRHGRRRAFPRRPGAFLLDGRPVTLVLPRPTRPTVTRTASGSVAVSGLPARVARGSRLFVEGRHDAELIERIWGDDLRVEGVVVEILDGVDHLPDVVAAFAPAPGRRLGVLVDHLLPNSKEARLATAVSGPHVLVAGHPYIDVWQAVKPERVGIPAWPQIPPGQPWKEGVCAALGWPDPPEAWRRILARVNSYRDLEVPLLRAVEQLVDFVTEPMDEPGDETGASTGAGIADKAMSGDR